MVFLSATLDGVTENAGEDDLYYLHIIEQVLEITEIHYLNIWKGLILASISGVRYEVRAATVQVGGYESIQRGIVPD